MKTLTIIALLIAGGLSAQNTIKLEKPELDRGKSIMKSLSERKSTRTFAKEDLSMRDLSDLIWAANGVNRPDGKRTAPSARNLQDIKVYVCLKDGNYLYNHIDHSLIKLSDTDARLGDGAVMLVLVGDTDSMWAAIDAGIVSQNISLFCSGNNLGTYARGTMDKEVLKKALNLKGEQTPMLCHPVGYFAK